jgi:exopolysaccharide biosynthesis protein
VARLKRLPIVHTCRQRRGLLLQSALLFLAFTVTARADWKVLSANSDSGLGGIFHRHVVLENDTAARRTTVDLAVFSVKSCTLRVFQNESGADGLGEMMRHEKCLAGVNGGYFNEEFTPIGLRIVNGKMIAPLQRARLISGVLLASSRGVQIVRAREFSPHSRVTAAVQCGPFLVDQLEPIRGLNDSRLARRTFAATTASDRALLGVCSEVSLAELSKILATASFAEDLKIERALNLDGGSSSAFWFARENGSAFSIPEQKPVRDFVGIVPK